MENSEPSYKTTYRLKRPANSTILTHTVVLFGVGDVPLKLSGEISKDANFLTSWDWDTGGSYESQHQKIGVKKNRTKNSKQMEIAYTLSIENYNPGPTNIENVIGH